MHGGEFNCPYKGMLVIITLHRGDITTWIIPLDPVKKLIWSDKKIIETIGHWLHKL